MTVMGSWAEDVVRETSGITVMGAVIRHKFQHNDCNVRGC